MSYRSITQHLPHPPSPNVFPQLEKQTEKAKKETKQRLDGARAALEKATGATDAAGAGEQRGGSAAARKGGAAARAAPAAPSKSTKTKAPSQLARSYCGKALRGVLQPLLAVGLKPFIKFHGGPKVSTSCVAVPCSSQSMLRIQPQATCARDLA